MHKLNLLLGEELFNKKSGLQSCDSCYFVWQLYIGDRHPLPGISLYGVAVSRLSHALNAVLVAALTWGGAVSFKKVLKAEDNQLAYTIQVGGFVGMCNPLGSCKKQLFAMENQPSGWQAKHSTAPLGNICASCL